MARKANITSLIVETDCLEVVELINNTKGNRTEIFWVIAEIQKQSKEFHKCTIQHVPRTCNAHAHNLAKFGLGGKINVVWLDLIPAEIQSIIDVL